MNPQYTIQHEDVDRFQETLRDSSPWWAIPDEGLENSLGKQRAAFVNAYGAALSAGELRDLSREDQDVDIERRAAEFYLKRYNGWNLGDEFRFNLPGRLAVLVKLKEIRPFTPRISPRREKGRCAYGWLLHWDPASISHESLR